MGTTSTCESDYESDVATGSARKEANKLVEELLCTPHGTLSMHSSEVENMLLSWRASPNGEDRQRLKADPDSVIRSGTLGCTRNKSQSMAHATPD